MEKLFIRVFFFVLVFSNFLVFSSFFGVLYAATQPIADTSSPFFRLLPASTATFYTPILSPFPSPALPKPGGEGESTPHSFGEMGTTTQTATEGLHLLQSDTQTMLSLLAVRDTTPPTVTVTLAGDLGKNNWYTSDVTVTITATDNENGSGVSTITYSLDNGKSFQPYTEPVIIDHAGQTTIVAKAIDNAGNIAISQPMTFQISKAAPELAVIFDAGTKQFEFLSQGSKDRRVAMNQSDSDITLQDAAGNTTTVTYEVAQSLQQASVTLKTITYGTNSRPQSLNASLSVVYGLDAITNQTLLLFQKAQVTQNAATIALYDSKHDMTVLEQTNGDKTTITTQNGSSLLKLATQQGTAQVSF